MTAKKSLSNDDGAVQTTAWRDMPVNWDGLSVTEYVNLLFRPNQPKKDGRMMDWVIVCSKEDYEKLKQIRESWLDSGADRRDVLVSLLADFWPHMTDIKPGDFCMVVCPDGFDGEIELCRLSYFANQYWQRIKGDVDSEGRVGIIEY